MLSDFKNPPCHQLVEHLLLRTLSFSTSCLKTCFNWAILSASYCYKGYLTSWRSTSLKTCWCWGWQSWGRVLPSMFLGPVTGPWAKIVLTHLKKLEKSWKNWKISWKNWKQSWKKWKPSWKIGPYMDDLYTSLQRI